MVQVGNLKRHVASCGFSPVQCSNDGCNVLLNVRDKLYHEAEVCDFRKSKYHDCGQLKNDEIKDEMLKSQDQRKNEMQGMKNEMRCEIKNEVKKVEEMMENEIKGMVENEMKEIRNKMKNELTEMKVEIKNEMKGMIKNEMKVMKEEVKEIVMSAVQDAMAGIKDLEVERKKSEQSSQASWPSHGSSSGNQSATPSLFTFGGTSGIFNVSQSTDQPVLFNMGSAQTTLSNKVYRKAVRRNRR